MFQHPLYEHVRGPRFTFGSTEFGYGDHRRRCSESGLGFQRNPAVFHKEVVRRMISGGSADNSEWLLNGYEGLFDKGLKVDALRWHA